tara:strand:+ start:1013 stop:1462 length:450 start_codon:yes stop_codon:yes gene_type:complete
MIANNIKIEVDKAVKAGDRFRRDILKTLLGEIQSRQMTAKKFSDEDAINIVRKFKQGVQETVDILSPRLDEAHNMPDLFSEIAIYDEFLPQQIDFNDIKYALENLLEDIKNANSVGQAMGIAMKQMKSEGLTADGNDVKSVVESFRTKT